MADIFAQELAIITTKILGNITSQKQVTKTKMGNT